MRPPRGTITGAVFSERWRYNAGLALLLALLFGGGWALLASAELLAAGTPPAATSLAALGLLNALLIFLLCSYLRAAGGVAAFLRVHLVALLSITILLALAKLALIFTTLSALWIPMVALPLLFGLRVERRAATGIAVVGAVALAALIGFDLTALLVMLVQGLTASAIIRPRRRGLLLVVATLCCAAVGAAAYLGVQLMILERDVTLAMVTGSVALEALPGSNLAAAAGSALAGGLLARIAVPGARAALGQISRARLTALANFENELLRRLAAEAPGTWAHSTSLANLAELAAGRVGADGLLLRVGAYYHDVGKSPHPQFFVENQRGENPHDGLDPVRSASVIRDHVPDGVRLARRAGLPEAIVEFIYTHHGTERLEYFWHRAEAQPEPHVHVERDFRYEGIPPLTQEQGLLCLCDAVEAASRTLKEAEQIEPLVRQIVMTKLQSGALDGSGLGLRELRLVAEACVEYLGSSLHARVEYPWQRRPGEEGEAEPEPEPDPEEAPTMPVPLVKRRRPR